MGQQFNGMSIGTGGGANYTSLNDQFALNDQQAKNNAFGQNNAGINQGKLASQNFGFQSALQGQQLDLQRYLGDQSNSTARYGIDQNSATTRNGQQLQYQAAILDPTLKQQRFNTVFPFLQGALAQYGPGYGSSTAGYTGNGPVGGAQPNIKQGGVYSDSQIQQQVNAARSGNDQKTAGSIRDSNANLAGRGFGSNSPLAMALNQNFANQNLATNTANERDTRMNAAQQNAQQGLAASTAAENQYSNRQNEDIERNKTRVTALNSWLGTLGSLV